jgi:murein L,D-transpeptidase YcbB/YkuD
MRIITILFLATATILQSCAIGDNKEVNASDSTAFVRDTSITPANAYSDLFLDSSAIAGFIEREKLEGSTAQMFRNFYTVRNNQFAWFHSTGLTEEGRSFWTLSSANTDSSVKAKEEKNNALKKGMDSLMQNDSLTVAKSDTSYIQKELALTRAFIDYAANNKGSINQSNMYYIVPRKKMDALQLADSIVNRQKDSSLSANKSYAAMKQQLGIYYTAASNGGWQQINARGLKKGASSPAVAALKKRLQATNDYPAGDTSSVFSDSLVNAVKDVQLRNGLAATGVVNDSLIAVLNVPATERVQQLLVNMNRLMWMQDVAESNRIEINLPSQMLYVYEGSNKVMEMPVIVGKEGTSTVAFSGKISEVVFSPSWNIPQSIVRNEIMPAMKKDPSYLQKKNMEVKGKNDTVPVIVQKPGKENPLGKVKFLFPNSYDIYLHDTPDKSLFSKSNRALSHGCIRVADPEKLVMYVLRNQKDWTPEKIRSAMNGKDEQHVAVANPQPVQISNLSAWIDVSGKLNMRNDVNGKDKMSYARLFTNAATSADVANTKTVDSLKVKNEPVAKKQVSR